MQCRNRRGESSEREERNAKRSGNKQATKAWVSEILLDLKNSVSGLQGAHFTSITDVYNQVMC
jgi:hypothetical protein